MPPELNDLLNQLEKLNAPSLRIHGVARAARKLIRELKMYSEWEAIRTQTEERARMMANINLQIGGGNHRIDRYVNIDLVPPADLLWDVREGLPFRDETVTAIFSEHFLEHIDYPVSVRTVLAECHRVLCRNGVLRLGVPDAGLVVRAYVADDIAFCDDLRERWYGRRGDEVRIVSPFDLVNYVFRDDDDSAKYTPHLWAYDLESLSSLLIEAGFSKIQLWNPNPSLINPRRIHASLYVEAFR